MPGDLLPEPSRACSMTAIPASLPHRDRGTPQSRRQALPKQHLNGRAHEGEAVVDQILGSFVGQGVHEIAPEVTGQGLALTLV